MAELPKVLHTVFNHMEEYSELLTKRDLFQDPTQSEETIQIWRGQGKDISERTGIHVQNVYTSIGKLCVLECLVKLRHGSRTHPSVYQILKQPDKHEYSLMRERSVMSETLKLPSASARAQDSINRLITRINELERRIHFLEQRDSIKGMLP